MVDEKPVYKSDGSPKSKLTWDFSQISKLRFGKYTAKLLLVYNDGKHDIPVEREVTFWVMPWRIIGGVLVFLILANVGGWVLGRSAWRRVRKPARK